MDKAKWPARSVLPVAVPGIKYIIGATLVTGVLFYFGWMLTALAATGLTLFVCWFFRDPDRQAPPGDKTLVSPADGRVIIVDRVAASEYLDDACQKVSIFMNVFNVHVNRIPFDGVVEKVVYTPGKFVNASFDKASVHNERNALTIRTAEKKRFVVVQIAGLVARRIVNCATAGQRVIRGERYGMIQFGSRLDLYLPMDFQVQVKKGDRTRAGVTIIGFFPGP
ncbi:MAG: phosphatidylserine decarboxylase family protein [Desulfotignum sp.]|nr:phosphatidylserine decarboxylase family protein [Desulfotignum sp.]MCF8113861.1 phosphatidylserine decarboxylase family protein [Desulfotignum sp.]MCF8126149.1 phosphatidylserine decarboxylase family protein [Desulfotignum sp.]